jgi:hypothetical protein
MHLLRAAAAHGITRDNVREAFKYRPAPKVGKAPKVNEPLRLKAFKRHPNGRAPTLSIDFSADPLAAVLRAEVEAMNTFAAATPVEGCLPPRWFRQFIGCFRLFGRICAAGPGNYQSMAAAERLRSIRIAGEPVVEIDIRASLLTFLHGALRLPLPEGDLYALPGIPRDVAKFWINATLGKGTPVDKWPKDSPRAPPELHKHPAPAVKAAALARYPFLADPSSVAEEFRLIAEPRRALIHALMGVEADVILAALQALRAESILGLPMHDGIIVPASAEARACELLRQAAEREVGVELGLKVDRPATAILAGD